MILLYGSHLDGRSYSGKIKWLSIILLAVVATQSLFCSKKIAPFEPATEPGISNKWVYDSLKRYYYWSDQMISKPDYTLPTQEFFRRLLYSGDRFSSITNQHDVIPRKSTFELYGFYYSLITHPFDAQQLVGVVTMVIPGTNADKLHIKRGTFFIKKLRKVKDCL